MKVLRLLAIGFSPAILCALGMALGSFGFLFLLPAYLLAIPVSFAAGFGIADSVTASSGKNLLLGFAFTSVFLTLNFGVCITLAGWGHTGD